MIPEKIGSYSMSRRDGFIEAGSREDVPCDDELVKIEIPIELAEVLSTGNGLSEGSGMQRFCRVCLHANGDMSCIFTRVHDKQLAEMLATFTCIQCSSEDGMPPSVCSGCRELIIQSYEFKQKCERSDTALRAFLDGEIVYSIKSEEDTSGNCINNDNVDFIDDDINSSHSEDGTALLKLDREMNLVTDSELKFTDSINLFNVKPKEAVLTKDRKVIKNENLSNEDLKSGHKKARESCGVCGKRFRDAEKLARHIERVHEPELSTKCELCGKVFKSQRGLRQHVKLAHCEDDMERPFKCPQCELSFLSEKDLKIHSAIHSEGILTCYECKKEFTTLIQLKRHIKRHMDDKPYKCDLCDKTFTEMFSMYRHQRSHFGTVVEKKHECDVCNKKFAEKSSLTVHMRQHTGERPYVCLECGKDFLSARLLGSHTRTHVDHKPYKCGICAKSFRHTATLATHRRTHTGERPYVCSTCGKSFIQSSNLTLHSRVHSGERPYACNMCGKKFTAWSTMKAHERIHTGEKPYSCKICGQRFARMDLKAHMRRHSGERPFTCTLCDKAFFTSLRLAEHSRLHSGIKPFECGICGLKIATKASYLRHGRKHRIANTNKVTQDAKPKPVTVINIEFTPNESTDTSALNICDNVDGLETVIDQSGNIKEVIRADESIIKYEIGDQMPIIEFKGVCDEPVTPIDQLTVTTGKGRRLSMFRIESSGGKFVMDDQTKSLSLSDSNGVSRIISAVNMD